MSFIGWLLVLFCGFLISRGNPPSDAFFFLIIGLFLIFKDYIISKKK